MSRPTAASTAPTSPPQSQNGGRAAGWGSAEAPTGPGAREWHCSGTVLFCGWVEEATGWVGLRGGPRTEGLASRLCGCQRRPGGLWPKAARQGQGWAGSEGSGRVRELGRAGPSRAERGHAPTAAIMGWRGPGEGGGSGGGEGRQWVLWDGEAFCGGGGKGEPRLLWDGEAFRHRRGAGGWQEYYGMASPSAAGGGGVVG